ncbi:MAG: sensor histidine kinase, partial [Intestinibacter sp.]
MVIHLEGLRRRVVKYYFIMIAITVVLFEVLFIFYMKEYYHGMARTYLEQQVDNISATNFTSFEDAINDILEREGVNKDINLGIQIINKDKEVLLDEYGIKTGEKLNYDDINNALMGSEGYNIFTYNILKTKDHVMSI